MSQICAEQNLGGWDTVYDQYYKAPYMVKGNLWIGFDNAISLAHKVGL